MKSLILVSILLASFSAWSQTGRVSKVKGTRAIVDFDSGNVPVGTVVTVGGGSGAGGASVAGSGSRQHGVAASMGYTSSTTKVASSSSDSKETNLEISYGYNMGAYELGGTFNLDSTESGGAKTATTLIGGYGHYNFVENKVGENFIPYVRGQFGLLAADAGAADFSGTLFGFGAGMLYFPWQELFAVEARLMMNQGNLSFSGGGTGTLSQMNLEVGWKVYF